jgi:sec-independent protein translocase protein TatA
MNTPIIFAIGMPSGSEWMLIFLAVLLLFGAKKLPEFARGLGRSMGEFKKARQEFEHEISKTVEEKDAKI